MTLNQLASSKNWSVPAPLPKVADRDWPAINLLGLVFLVMAVTQAFSFGDFKVILFQLGVGSVVTWTWGVGIIIAEVWAAVTFLKIRLPSAVRLIGTLLSILVAGFWFVQNIQQVTGMHGGNEIGYFGKYLSQMPGWWTIIEVTILLFWTLYAVDKVKNN